MTALSERDFPRDEKFTGGMTTLYMRVPTATIELFRGGLVAHRLGSKYAEIIDPAAPRSDLVIMGWADNYVRATTTAWSGDANVAADADDQPLTVNVKGDGWIGRNFDVGAGVNALTANDVGAIVYAYDSNTLYKTDNGGTLSAAGTLACFNSVDGLASLDIRAPKAAVILGASGAAQEAPRAVVTTLGANTVTAGVMSYDAVGAFGTQDGVSTLIAGDTVLIQAGTTNLDAAGDAGPWEIQTLGTASVIHVMRRPSWWAHGSPIKQSARVRIGGEGTLFAGSTWQSFAANTAVVGTTDPAMYPDQVTQSITLVAGHVAVTNVAIRSATKTNYIMRRITANTTTLTLEYVPLSITPGAIGTATVDVTAAVAAGTINVADISTLLLSIVNF